MFLFDTDHITVLDRASGAEFSRLAGRMNRLPDTDFFVSVVSFHEQVLGWNSYINSAHATANVLRGYQGLADTLRRYAKSNLEFFDASSLHVF